VAAIDVAGQTVLVVDATFSGLGRGGDALSDARFAVPAIGPAPRGAGR